MKKIATIIALLSVILLGSQASAQPMCDFLSNSNTSINTWTDNNGAAITDWQSAPANFNYEIITSSIANPSAPAPYVLHSNPKNGVGGQSPQWVASPVVTGFDFDYSQLQWSFWFGRRANNGQNGGNADRSTVWLYVNRTVDLDDQQGLQGIRLSWHHNTNKDAIELVKVSGSTEVQIANFILLDNLSDYQWGTTVRVVRIPEGFPTGSQARWQIYLSTPAVDDPNFSSASSVSADADPVGASIYQRVNVVESGTPWKPLSQSGYLALMSDFAGSREDAAEYNQLCFTNFGTVPVELTSFTANYRNDEVILKWNTATEVQNFGFEIERSIENSDTWETIGFVEGSGTSNSPRSYSYTDNPNFDGVKTIAYRLKQIDRDGAYDYSNTVYVNVVPSSMDMLYNFPNPFNPSTNISFNLGIDDVVTLTVFNSTGEKVASLYENESMEAGIYTTVFSGHTLPSGTYFYSLTTSEGTSIKSMVLTK